MSIKGINSPSINGDKRTSSSVSIDHLIWVEVCTWQSTDQSCEYKYEHVFTVNNTKVTEFTYYKHR